MSATRLSFGRAQRLRGRGSFKVVMEGRARSDAAEISVHARPNDAAHSRLGISIGRRVGTAAARNRIKRLLREAYRLSQHELPQDAPAPYDIVVVVRPHPPRTLDAYRTALAEAMRHLHSTWQKRSNRRLPREERPSQPGS